MRTGTGPVAVNARLTAGVDEHLPQRVQAPAHGTVRYAVANTHNGAAEDGWIDREMRDHLFPEGLGELLRDLCGFALTRRVRHRDHRVHTAFLLVHEIDVLDGDLGDQHLAPVRY